MRTAALLAASLALTSCGLVENKKAAEAEVARFHDRFNSRQYAEVFEAASPEMRASGSRDNFSLLMTSVHKRLGPVQSSKQVSWNAYSGTGGSTVTLVYDTRFANASGQETFVFKSKGKQLQLNGYNINSPALVVPTPAYSITQDGRESAAVQ